MDQDNGRNYSTLYGIHGKFWEQYMVRWGAETQRWPHMWVGSRDCGVPLCWLQSTTGSGTIAGTRKSSSSCACPKAGHIARDWASYSLAKVNHLPWQEEAHKGVTKRRGSRNFKGICLHAWHEPTHGLRGEVSWCFWSSSQDNAFHSLLGQTLIPYSPGLTDLDHNLSVGMIWVPKEATLTPKPVQ